MIRSTHDSFIQSAMYIQYNLWNFEIIPIQYYTIWACTVAVWYYQKSWRCFVFMISARSFPISRRGNQEKQVRFPWRSCVCLCEAGLQTDVNTLRMLHTTCRTCGKKESWLQNSRIRLFFLFVCVFVFVSVLGWSDAIFFRRLTECPVRVCERCQIYDVNQLVRFKRLHFLLGLQATLYQRLIYRT